MRKKLNDNKLVNRFYKNSPYPLQSLLFSFNGLLIYKMLKSSKFRKILKKIESNQWKDQEEVKVEQFKKLKIMLHHCYKNVPYYRNLFVKNNINPNDINSFDDFKQVPYLTKEEVKSNYDKLTAINVNNYNPFSYHTGGTTGLPLHFLIDEHMLLMRYAEKYRHWRNQGYRFRDKMAVLRGRILFPDHKITGNLWRDDYIQRFKYFSMYHMDDSTVSKYLNKIESWKPKYLQSYPMTAFLLAKKSLEESRNINLKGVFTSSETLFPHYREVIEAAFGCKVFDHYGLGEPGTWVSGQCNELNHHYSADLSYIETDSNNEIIQTSLMNFSMPFLRYKTGDSAILSHKECNCGRGFPVIKNIVGRVDDFFETSNGQMSAGMLITHVSHHSPNVDLMQIIHKSRDLFEVNIVVNDSFKKEDEEKIEIELSSRLGTGVNFSINRVSSIPISKNGKFKYFIHHS